MAGSPSKRYGWLNQRAVGEYAGVWADHDTAWAAMGKVADSRAARGGPETLRKWIRPAEMDQSEHPGITSEESAEVKRMKREKREREKRESAKLPPANLNSTLQSTKVSSIIAVHDTQP